MIDNLFPLGIIAATNRNYANVAVWNEPGAPLTLNAAGAIVPAVKEEDGRANTTSSINTTFATMMNILKNSQMLQKKLHETAHTLEVIPRPFQSIVSSLIIFLIRYGRTHLHSLILVFRLWRLVFSSVLRLSLPFFFSSSLSVSSLIRFVAVIFISLTFFQSDFHCFRFSRQCVFYLSRGR